MRISRSQWTIWNPEASILTEIRGFPAARQRPNRSRRSGLSVVVSDLFDEHGFQPGLDQLRYRRFDGHVSHLFSNFTL